MTLQDAAVHFDLCFELWASRHICGLLSKHPLWLWVAQAHSMVSLCTTPASPHHVHGCHRAAAWHLHPTLHAAGTLLVNGWWRHTSWHFCGSLQFISNPCWWTKQHWPDETSFNGETFSPAEQAGDQGVDHTPHNVSTSEPLKPQVTTSTAPTEAQDDQVRSLGPWLQWFITHPGGQTQKPVIKHIFTIIYGLNVQ